jgi:hypothetical protein
LFTSTKFFPGSSSFFLGDLEFALHLSKLLICIRPLALFLDRFFNSCSSMGSFILEASLQISLDFLCTFLLSPGLKEPALEFAFRGSTQALKLNNCMEEVGSCSRKVGYLARKLLRERITVDIVAVIFESADPE